MTCKKNLRNLKIRLLTFFQVFFKKPKNLRFSNQYSSPGREVVRFRSVIQCCRCCTACCRPI